MATYRIDVGKRHKIGPGAIVGAIANEGGLHRSDFGHIAIHPDFSLVELPAKLPRETLKALGAHPYFGCADQPAARPQAGTGRPGASRHDAVPRRSRRAGRPGVGIAGRAGRVADGHPRGGRAVGDGHPRGLHHRQVHPRLSGARSTRAWRSVCRSSSCCPGFCCSVRGCARPREDRPPPSVARYAWHRVRRIMPAYVITVLAAYVRVPAFAPQDPIPGHPGWACSAT